MLLRNLLHEQFVLQSAIKENFVLVKKYENFQKFSNCLIDFFGHKTNFWKMLLSKLLNRK